MSFQWWISTPAGEGKDGRMAGHALLSNSGPGDGVEGRSGDDARQSHTVHQNGKPPGAAWATPQRKLPSLLGSWICFIGKNHSYEDTFLTKVTRTGKSIPVIIDFSHPLNHTHLSYSY